MARQGRHMINYRIKIAKETSNRGVDVIVDFVGKDYFEKNIDTLAIDGRMVILAYLSGKLYPHPHITIITHFIHSIGGVVEKVNIVPLLKKRLRVCA